MRMNKGSILASMVVIALASVFAGAGTMAWFSETGKAGITITAGNVNLRLSKTGADGSWDDDLLFDFPEGFAPGDSYTVHVWLKNIGNAGSKTVWVYGDNLVEGTPGRLSHRIFITDVAFTDRQPGGTGRVWCHPGGGTFYETGTADTKIIFGDGASPLTLYEFCTSRTATTWGYMRFFWGTWCERDYLMANGANIEQVKLTFYFDEEAGNDYQNKVCNFDIVFLATDDPGYGIIWEPAPP